MKPPAQRVQTSRMVGYRWTGVDLDEAAFERLCAQGVRDGYVLEYDGGRGRDPWVNGKPGPALRALRQKVDALAASTKKDRRGTKA